MDLYEHQGKELFARYGIPTGEGRVARTPEEARAGAEALGGGRVVVKAQVLAGGRGKAGGVKVADDPADAEEKTRGILGLDIKGHITRRVWVEKAISIDKEYYFSITFDRGAKANLFMLSTMGGMDIEAVAVDHPVEARPDPPQPRDRAAAVLRAAPAVGRRRAEGRAQGRRRADHEGLRDVPRHRRHAGRGEPAGDHRRGRSCVAADAKVTIDDNALFRHPDIEEMRDTEAADPQEQMARERDVTYVKLDGTIGILGNGAGLVMSTLDVVDQVGGKPANFLDVGGGADADKIVTALEVILSDPKVEAILFNIFGGITRCDEVAKGILAALEQLTIDVPIVVRLDGTNDVEGRKLLADAAPANVYPERTMLDAARKVVELAKGR